MPPKWAQALGPLPDPPHNGKIRRQLVESIEWIKVRKSFPLCSLLAANDAAVKMRDKKGRASLKKVHRYGEILTKETAHITVQKEGYVDGRRVYFALKELEPHARSGWRKKLMTSAEGDYDVSLLCPVTAGTRNDLSPDPLGHLRRD